MTPKIIELKQAPVVLVELPTNPSNNEEISIERTKSGVACCISYPTTPGMCRTVSLPVDFPDYVKMIGILSDLTEEQFAECVPKEMYSHLKDQEAIWYEAIFIMDILHSENVYTENPYGVTYKRMPESDMDYRSFLKWQEAQSRTIDPKRTVVLIKKED